MNAALLPAALLAALHVLWFLAFLADARSARNADPIGRVLRTWLRDPSGAEPTQPRRRRRNRRPHPPGQQRRYGA